MKTIDAGHGGGQVLRSALSLAALTGQAVHVTNIRQNRPKPGLQMQHRACVQALAAITQGRCRHDDIGSNHVIFEPGPVRSGMYEFDIGTAGSCSLLLQCLLPPLFFADKPSSIRIVGGTDVPFSPPSLFLQQAFCPALEKMGARVTVDIKRHGFYPKGGGVLEAFIQPPPLKRLAPLLLESRGSRSTLEATILSAQLPAHVAEREKAVLQQAGVTHIESKTVEAANAGNLVFLKADYGTAAMGFDALGKIGKSAEQVAQEALDRWRAFEATDDALEPHLLDQLLLYAALTDRGSRIRVEKLSEHAASNLHVVHEMLGTNHRHEGHMLEINGKKPRIKAPKS